MDASQQEIAERIRNLPEEWWKVPRVCRGFSHQFSRHLLGLGIACPKDGTVQTMVCTGFLLTYEDCPYWITAGHVLEEIKDLISHFGKEHVKGIWIEHSPEDRGTIRVDVTTLDSHIVGTRDPDIGVVKLTWHDSQLLRANPSIQFLNNDVWRGLDRAEPEGFFLVGIPAERVEKEWRRDGNQMKCDLDTELRCIPLERLGAEEVPESFRSRKAAGSFYARLLNEEDPGGVQLDSIGGMSGGPILSIERRSDGELVYRLYGIQSSWLRERRIIRATSVNEIPKCLEQFRNN